MKEKNMIFLDGLMIPATNVLAQALTPGILSGRGVFETMRSYRGNIFALEEHLQRLFQSLEALGLQAPCSQKKMKFYLQETLRLNRLKNARLRLVIWRSKQGVRISIAAFSYKPALQRKYKQGFRAMFSDICRNERAQESRIKSINYLPLLLAHRQARAQKRDEAILLNRKGFLAEGSKTNIFFISQGILKTPHVACGCLEGITRQKVFQIADQQKIQYQQGHFLPQHLLEADEAFCTNSLIEIMPLTRVQGTKIGLGTVGLITKQIMSAYRRQVQNFLKKP